MDMAVRLQRGEGEDAGHDLDKRQQAIAALMAVGQKAIGPVRQTFVARTEGGVGQQPNLFRLRPDRFAKAGSR